MVVNSERLHGLTDGLSSRIMRNRTALVPSLMMMHENNADNTDVLHGRLEELLVFEILKDGYVDISICRLAKYLHSTVRTAHKLLTSFAALC